MGRQRGESNPYSPTLKEKEFAEGGKGRNIGHVVVIHPMDKKSRIYLYGRVYLRGVVGAELVRVFGVVLGPIRLWEDGGE
jgi:hypothetical protein